MDNIESQYLNQPEITINTLYHRRIIFGVAALIILIFLVVAGHPHTLASAVSSLLLLSIFLCFILKKNLYKILLSDSHITLHFRTLAFINKEEKYPLKDLKFKIKTEIYFRGGKTDVFYISDATSKIILKENRVYIVGSDIDQLVNTVNP